uniref:Uncharacterized protein n=1 Tax=Vannella robusta TaxID=1487602 RepID=A0A7S4MKR1_9EUKA|mmetsp:Transcript_25468/g.32428  ORF Transcript_25468/g.32428 Transcript_25468/m.32428 type:complete len:130 (+) Transcript_25468:207-596(+)
MKNEVKQKDLFELLVAPVINDPLVQSKPVYYSHLIIQKDKLEQFRDIRSLQHKSFAYNGKDSFSGWGAMQKYLYEQKNEWSSLPDAVDVHTVMDSFFSSLVLSGSHRNSLQLVSNVTALKTKNCYRKLL